MSATRQLSSLLIKNFILKRRLWRQTIGEFLTPLVLGVCVGLLVFYSNYQQNRIETPIQKFGQASWIFVLCFVVFNASFLSSTSFLLSQLVTDKESGMRESLKIMSLNRWAYAMSFYLSQSVFTVFTTLVVFGVYIGIINGRTDLPNERISMCQDSPESLFFALLLFGLGLLAMTMLISTIFTDSKLSVQMGTFLLFLPVSTFLCCLVAVIMQKDAGKSGSNFLQIGYILPQFSFGVIILDSFFANGAKTLLDLNVIPAWICLFLSTPCYLGLYVYLDSIVPNALGIRLECCFCCKRKHMVRNEYTSVQDPEFSVTIHKLAKDFGKFTAVAELDLGIKQGEVLCLLGHNGAGKTTLINMLTGMLQPTTGDAMVFGHSLVYEIDKVRQSLGFCQQKDVLFQNLTVIEHLRLVCELKCVAKSQVQFEIQSILKTVMLADHKSKLISELSGGMKRKLSLAMALVGESKLVVLDEPTSGLDVDSRRQVWDVIREAKQSRSILLSTQHIEEADVLADRVCIMSHGKVIALDSPKVIKAKFGVGYSLVLESQTPPNQQEFDSIVMKHLQKVVVKEVDVVRFKIVYLVPAEQLSLLADLVQDLKQPGLTISIEITSLQDAYFQVIQVWCEGLGDDELLDSDLAIKRYLQTRASPSCCKQIVAMFKRRLLQFLREPRQWFIVFSPFLNVLTTFLIIFAMLQFVMGENSQQTVSTKEIMIQGVSTLFPFIMNYGFCACSGVYLLMPLEDRQTKIRGILNLNGLAPFSYWTGMLLGDYLIYLLPCVFFMILTLALQLAGFSDHFWEMFAVFLTFGASLITATYFVSQMFGTQNQAVKWITPLYLIGGSLIPLVIFTVGLFAVEDKFLDALMCFIYSISPFSCFYISNYRILYKASSNSQILFSNNNGVIQWVLMGDVVIGPAVFSLQALVYFCLTIIVDFFRVNRFRKPDGKRGQREPSLCPVYQDALDHQTELEIEEDFFIQARGLSKAFSGKRGKKPFQAVQNVSLGVKKGEIMGLIGPNGAGKSTAFGIMAMQQQRSQGDLKLLGMSLEKIDTAKTADSFGICPQYDSCFEVLTVGENLRFLADIKGLSRADSQHNIKLLVKTMELTEFMDIKACNLSGGNRRKLSCALTLLLSPKIDFLDEPTTGVDPVSRRSLFKMIKKLQNSSVLMTTHRMDEAEQLCDKIAIMINGQIVCVGTPSYLLQQYGSGYQFTLQIALNKLPLEANSYLQQSELHHVELLARYLDKEMNQMVAYKVMVDGNLHVLLRTLNELKSNGLVSRYEVSRANLDHVFTHFARFQHNPVAALAELAEAGSHTQQNCVSVQQVEMNFLTETKVVRNEF